VAVRVRAWEGRTHQCEDRRKAGWGLLDEIASRILGIVEVNKEDLDPFVMKSDEA
jgi:hypothetical protein